jgi:hypothetical protein
MATWRREVEEYEADLYEVREPTLLSKLLGLFLQTKHGELETKTYDNGEKEMEIKLHGVNVPDGSTVSAVVDGIAIRELRVSRGYVRLFLATAQGDTVPNVRSGSITEIRYQGVVLLQGTFRPD